MDVTYRQPDLGPKIYRHSITIAIVEKEMNRLLHLMSNPLCDLPHQTVVFIMYAMLNDRLTAQTASTIEHFDIALSNLIQLWESMNEAIAGIISQAKSRALQNMLDKSTVDRILHEIGNAGPITLTETALLTIVHHALPGSAPRDSQAAATKVAHDFHKHTVTLWKLAENATYLELKTVLAYANLVARLSYEFETRPYNPSAATTGKGEDMNASRLAALKALEAQLIGANAAACTELAGHLSRWISQPLLAGAITLMQDERLTSLREAHSRRGLDTWPYAPRACYNDAAKFEGVLTAKTAIEEAGRREGVADLDAAILTGDRTGFERDFTIRIQMSTNDMAGWVDLTMRYLQISAAAGDALKHLKTVGATVIPTTSPELPDDLPVLGLSQAAGYPDQLKTRASYVIPPSRRAFWAAGVLPTRVTTLARLRCFMDKFQTPVRLIGDVLDPDQKRLMHAEPKLEPVFGNLEEGPQGLPMTLRSFCDLQDLSEAFMPVWFAELTQGYFEQETSLAHNLLSAFVPRGIAESLVHVGVLALHVNETAYTITPLRCHWYHARQFSDDCFGPSFDIAQGATGDVKWAWKLRPFVRIPDSAHVKNRHANICSISLAERDPTLPLVRWIQEGMANATSVTITGWRRCDPRLADIYLMDAKPEGIFYYITAGVGGTQKHCTVAPVNRAYLVNAPPAEGVITTQLNAADFRTLNSLVKC